MGDVKRRRKASLTVRCASSLFKVGTCDKISSASCMVSLYVVWCRLWTASLVGVLRERVSLAFVLFYLGRTQCIIVHTKEAEVEEINHRCQCALKLSALP